MFPVGSDYRKLESNLLAEGFEKMPQRESGRFAFIYYSPFYGEYAVVAYGRYDAERNIVEIGAH
jgi:hypothetical protein